MDDRVNGLFFKHFLESVIVAAIDLVEGGTDAGDRLDAIEDRNLRVREIVDDDGRMARGEQGDDGCAADETRAPRN